MKLTNNFSTQEFVPQHIYEIYGDKSIWFIDYDLVKFAQALRDFVMKPITINNWASGGSYQYRGFRPSDCKEGAALSQHRFGRAIDLSVDGMFIAEVAEIVISRREVWWPQITTMENVQYTPTWLHVDKRHTGQKELLIVDPV